MPEKPVAQAEGSVKSGTNEKDAKNKPQPVRRFADIDDYAELKKEALSI